MKNRAVISALFAAVICLAGPPLAGKNSLPVRVVGFTNTAPFEFHSRDGTPQGIYIDLWKYWAEKNSFEIRYIIAENSEQALSLVNAGKADIVMGIMGSTLPLSGLNLSVPIWISRSHIYTNEKISTIKSISQLPPFTVGIISEELKSHHLGKLYSTVNFAPAGSISDLLGMVERGRINVFIADSASAWFEISRSGKWRNFSRSAEPVFQNSIFAAVRASDTDLLEAVNATFTSMEEAEQDIIEKSWTGGSLGYSIPWVIVSTVIIIAVIIAGVLLSGYWNFALQKKVRNATEELETSRSTLRDIIDSMPSMLFLTDRNGRILDSNKNAKIIMEQKETSEPATAIQDVQPFMIHHLADIEDSIKNSEPRDIKKQKTQGRGKEKDRYYDISIYPLSAIGIDSAVVRIEDVTEFAVQEKQLRQSQKMETIGTIAGGIAHDFNNILGGIYGTVSLIKFKLANSVPDKKEMLEYISTIEQSSSRAAAMVKQLMTLSRRHEIEMEPCDLNKAVEEVVKICANTFDKTVSIQVQYYPEPAVITGDIRQLEQVLMNLCINASHAMTIMKAPGQKMGGELNISIDKAPSERTGRNSSGEETALCPCWQVRISDTGVGIKPEIIDKIFDPFFSTKHEKTGTGLGLAMVYSIIREHGGIIKAASQGKEGAGAEFTILLPASDSKISKNAKLPDGIIEGTGHIVYIDDEKSMRETVASMLKVMGYSVTAFSSGREAFKFISSEAQGIDAILTDLSMPDMSGKEIYEKIEEIAPSIPIGLTSGYRDDRRIIELRKKNNVMFLEKPFSIESLSDFISRLTESKNR